MIIGMGVFCMLGSRLKSLRVSKALTQADMANKIDVARTTYAMYEQNKREPDNEVLERIADFFDVTVDYLLGRTDLPGPVGQKYNPMSEINHLLKKYNLDQSGFFDIEKWKAMGPEEIRELESYFEFITSRAQQKSSEENKKNNQ